MKPRALVIGVGGLGSPAALELARSGRVDLRLIDDDVVDVTNLHRQTLFEERDVGRSKVVCAQGRLETFGVHVEAIEGRFVPDSAHALLEGIAVVVEGADNFATKFLAADACGIAKVPLVSAGAVRWSGWALASAPGAACLRCVFEDIPRDRVETCAEAGVIGGVVGVVGGIQALLALRVLEGRGAGELYSYRALEGVLRKTPVRRRSDCPLCAGRIEDLRVERYAPAACEPV